MNPWKQKSHFGGRNKWVSFGETSEISSKLIPLAVCITEFKKYHGNWEKIPPKTSLPLQVSCATEMDWKFGIPKGGFGTKGPRILCLLVGVLSPVVYLGK